MRSSTRLFYGRPVAAVLRAAAVAFALALFAAGCESMKDPNGQAIPWGNDRDWEHSRVPSILLNN